MGVAELTAKLESLSQEDYDMVVMLVERLSNKPSDVLKKSQRKISEQESYEHGRDRTMPK